MSRRKLLQHLTAFGCERVRQGGRHEIWWNPATRGQTAIPRHRTVKKPMVRSICDDLGIQLPPGL